jgi:hypothetical protein
MPKRLDNTTPHGHDYAPGKTRKTRHRMRQHRGTAISRFFEDLSAGDPVALGLVSALAVVGIALGVFVFFIRRKLMREDESRAKRYGRKP